MRKLRLQMELLFRRCHCTVVQQDTAGHAHGSGTDHGSGAREPHRKINQHTFKINR